MHDSEHCASACIALLLRAFASQRFGSQMRIIIPRAEAEMMREDVDVDGWVRWTRLMMDVTSAAMPSSMSRHAIVVEAIFSNLYDR